jgi:hypothetical protein
MLLYDDAAVRISKFALRTSVAGVRPLCGLSENNSLCCAIVIDRNPIPDLNSNVTGNALLNQDSIGTQGIRAAGIHNVFGHNVEVAQNWTNVAHFYMAKNLDLLLHVL